VAALTPADGSPPRLPPGGGERLDERTVTAERAVLGLRLREGIDLGLARHPAVRPALEWASTHGLVEPAPGERIRLTLSGRLVSNELFARLV